jgi:hypothetical protein
VSNPGAWVRGEVRDGVRNSRRRRPGYACGMSMTLVAICLFAVIISFMAGAFFMNK